LIKSDKDIYIDTKDFFFQINAVHLNFLFIKESQTKFITGFHKNMKQHN